MRIGIVVRSFGMQGTDLKKKKKNRTIFPLSLTLQSLPNRLGRFRLFNELNW